MLRAFIALLAVLPMFVPTGLCICHFYAPADDDDGLAPCATRKLVGRDRLVLVAVGAEADQADDEDGRQRRDPR